MLTRPAVSGMIIEIIETLLLVCTLIAIIKLWRCTAVWLALYYRDKSCTVRGVLYIITYLCIHLWFDCVCSVHLVPQVERTGLFVVMLFRIRKRLVCCLHQPTNHVSALLFACLLIHQPCSLRKCCTLLPRYTFLINIVRTNYHCYSRFCIGIRFTLNPGYYVVLPTTFDPAQEREFFMRIFSECSLHAM